MKINYLGKAMRFFFLFISSVIWAGIVLCGFSTVRWLLNRGAI